VRELRQMIDRALLFADGDEIDVAHLALDAAAPLGDARGPGPIDSPAERARIEEALVACAGNQSRAAKRLGMSRKAFLARLDAYGLPRPRRGGG
jgi:DNA-binding NtrC family response regulator